jgi:hypothetical protein
MVCSRAIIAACKASLAGVVIEAPESEKILILKLVNAVDSGDFLTRLCDCLVQTSMIEVEQSTELLAGYEGVNEPLHSLVF